MPFGFDDACGLVSLIGFSAAAFQGCIQGLVILSKARSFGRDVSGVRLTIEIEQHKLNNWAQEVGLLQNPRTLLVEAQHVEIVPKILNHICVLVTDLDKLKRSYGLYLQETDEEIVNLEHGDSAFGRLGITANDYTSQTQARIFSQRQKAWRILKWVTFDEIKVGKLIDQIRLFTQELQQILDQTRQAKMDKAADAILRNAVLSTANEQDLDMIGLEYVHTVSQQAIAAAARLKKQGLLLGVMNVQTTGSMLRLKRQDSPPLSRPRMSSSQTLIPRYSNSDLTAMRLSARLLNISHTSIQSSRALAYYSGDPVLLEFRNETGLDPVVAKDRMYKVSAFLKDLDPSFHGLSCRGYVKINHRYTYVFDLPTQSSVAPKTFTITGSRDSSLSLPGMRTLRDLFELPKPAISLRLSYAITILETLLQLHTSGWLHKEFRSENVLFITTEQQDELKDEEFLRMPLYVAGYVYARADTPQEATEPLETDLEADLYRHPISMSKHRVPYCKAFDMFGVGCILLEIGLWSSLSALLRRSSDSARFNKKAAVDLLRVRYDVILEPAKSSIGASSERLRYAGDDDGVLGMLNAAMGRTYTSIAIQMICAAEISLSKSVSSASVPEDDDKLLLDIEMECLEKLRDVARVI